MCFQTRLAFKAREKVTKVTGKKGRHGKRERREQRKREIDRGKRDTQGYVSGETQPSTLGW